MQPAVGIFLVGLALCWCGLLVLHHLCKPPGDQLSLPGMSIHDFRGSQPYHGDGEDDSGADGGADRAAVLIEQGRSGWTW